MTATLTTANRRQLELEEKYAVHTGEVVDEPTEPQQEQDSTRRVTWNCSRTIRMRAGKNRTKNDLVEKNINRGNADSGAVPDRNLEHRRV